MSDALAAIHDFKITPEWPNSFSLFPFFCLNYSNLVHQQRPLVHIKLSLIFSSYQFKSNRLVSYTQPWLKNFLKLSDQSLTSLATATNFATQNYSKLIYIFLQVGCKIRMGCYLQTQNYLLIYSNL